jgi:hypothetical protein
MSKAMTDDQKFWDIVTKEEMRLRAFHTYLIDQRELAIEKHGRDNYHLAYGMARNGRSVEAGKVLGIEVKPLSIMEKG